MPASATATEVREPLGKPFAGSLAAHLALGAMLTLSGYLHLTDTWGSPHASSGSVGVGLVKSIPIPRNEGKTNPLANDTQNLAPQETTPVRQKAREQAPDPAAIAIPDRRKTKNDRTRQAATQYKPMQYQANQVYARTGQATSSPMYAMQGAGGIDIGPASVLGNRFGAYVDLMRQAITQHWTTADVTARPDQKAAVTFTIARNGAVSDVRISQPSGSYLLDTSAKRAILDSNPLPALPAQFDRNQATVELWFQLKQ